MKYVNRIQQPDGRGEPGPAYGFRYWATEVDGRLKFGVQQTPKQELDVALRRALVSVGFELTPQRTEAFMWLERAVEPSIDPARATMAQLEGMLGRRS